jgi:hypothetical protein
MPLTIFDIASKIPTLQNDRATKIPVTKGLKPSAPPSKVGLVTLTPSQAASVVVPRLHLEAGEFSGYQRTINVRHARAIARAMDDGYPMPAVHLATDGNGGDLVVVDGQHRLVASLISLVPIKAVIDVMDPEEQARLFTGQRSAATVNRSTMVLAGSTELDKYVQEACLCSATGDPHPWSELVSWSPGGSRYLSAAQVHDLVGAYCANRLAHGGLHQNKTGLAFDQKLADELGTLLRQLGTRKTNPLAFKPMPVRSLASLAVLAIRRADPLRRAGEVDRWVKRMPGAPYSEWQWIRRDVEYLAQLVTYYNKGRRNRLVYVPKTPDAT